MRKLMHVLHSIKHMHLGLLFLTDALILFTASLFSNMLISSVTDFRVLGIRNIIGTVFPFVYTLLGLAVFRVYKIMLKHISTQDMLRCVFGIFLAAVLSAITETFFGPFHHSLFYVLYFLLAAVCVLVTRAVYNFVLFRFRVYHQSSRSAPTLIIGAGYTGTHVLHEILVSETLDYHPVGFVDDNPHLENHDIYNVPILGPTILIPQLCKKLGVKVIIFAIPSCPEDKRKKILSICAQTDCEIKVIPSIWELSESKKFLPQITTINVEDVLGRDPIKMDSADIAPALKDKVVLVTGVGSIGSEICRQAIKYKVKKLVMVDIYENNAYDIQQELISEGCDDIVSVEIASVRDYDKCKAIFAKHKPEIVFHAAAHKHVPLMETNPEEAIKNNVAGTYNIARLCEEFSAEKMVLISTDKAVNPTNVMGASKRCCEMIMQYMAQRDTECDFVAVRFGNVLGSNGSVIPLFIKQIEHGGPVTVTHPDIIRYFMTIPEAVSLVLEAGAMAKGGEIFVLDMGEPFKITTLAENIIKLYGYKPYEEMPIKFIGLRPGEKLFEELLMNEEGLKSTKNNSIFIGNQIQIDEESFIPQLNKIIGIAGNNDADGVISALKELVPTFEHK